jgi:hypothetical protein
MSGLLIFVRNIEACRTLGRPIYIGYSLLNKESSLENEQDSHRGRGKYRGRGRGSKG